MGLRSKWNHLDKVPGVLVCALVAFAAMLLSEACLVLLWDSPIRGLSSITFAVLVGLFSPRLLKESALLRPGFDFCVRHLLRVTIVLIGLRLSFTDVARIGLDGLPVILVCIAAALAVAWTINRGFGVPLRLALLISVGTSICGVSAILALGPLLKAEDEEVSYSVATITLFGSFALFFYPMIANHFFAGNSHAAGLFLGTSIHDTAQVAGAGLMYEQTYNAIHVLDVATVTKLVRNIFIIVVMPLAGLWFERQTHEKAATRRRWHAYIPGFIVGFVLMSLVRTLGDLNEEMAFGLIPARDYWDFVEITEIVTNQALAASMAAVGLSTSWRRMRQIGVRPFAVGFVTAAVVGMFSIGMLKVPGIGRAPEDVPNPAGARISAR